MNATENDPSTESVPVRLTLRSDLRISPRETAGEKYYLIEDPFSSRFYRIGVAEFEFMRMLDGCTVREAVDRYEQQRTVSRGVSDCQIVPERKPRLSRTNVARLCNWLVQHRLVQTDNLPAVEPSGEAKPSWSRYILFIRIPLFNPDRLLSHLLPWLAWTLTPVAAIVWGIVCLSGAWQIAVNFDRFASSVARIVSRDNWLWLLITWVGLKIVHETYHGLICKKYGGVVPQFGLSLILFSPVAFVDVTSSLRFPSKWQRIFTAAGGMYAEFLVAGVAAWIWAGTGTSTLNQFCHNVVVMASVSTLLFNANFLMRFDGYYIASDVLEIQNLYSLGGQYLAYFVRRYLLSVPASLPRWPTGRGLFVRAYAFASLAWRISFYVGVMVCLNAMFHGAGLVLAIVGAISWFLVPAVKFFQYLLPGTGLEQPNRLRFALVSLVMGLAASVVACLPWPSDAVAPGVIDYEPLTLVRSESSGFVKTVHVLDGQRVSASDILVTLDNPELRQTLADLELRIRQSQAKSRVLNIARDVAAYQVECANEMSLEQQRKELARQVEALSVRAKSNGQVIARDLESLLGQYIPAGTEFLAIGDEGRKRIKISISQRDFDLFQSKIGCVPQVRTQGLVGRIENARLTEVYPKASTRLTHVALGAQFGGPLAVKDKSTSAAAEMELAEPRFSGSVEIPASVAKRLHSGVPARVRIGSTSESIGEHIWNILRDWLAR